MKCAIFESDWPPIRLYQCCTQPSDKSWQLPTVAERAIIWTEVLIFLILLDLLPKLDLWLHHLTNEIHQIL